MITVQLKKTEQGLFKPIRKLGNSYKNYFLVASNDNYDGDFYIKKFPDEQITDDLLKKSEKALSTDENEFYNI